MGDNPLIISRINSVLHVINNNPKARNALRPAYYAGLIAALDLAEKDSSIAAVVLSGAGGFFCAGGDLNALKTRAAMTEPQRIKAINGLHDVIRAITSCPCPVIAAIEGGAAGAGVPLALACDLIVAAEDSYFSVAYVKIGLVPDGGTSKFLRQLAPRQLVNELCFFGDKMPAKRLSELGAINRLTEPGQSVNTAVELGERLADMGPEALATIKSLTVLAGENSLEDQLDLEAKTMAKAQGGREAAEGISSFLAKRKPDFQQFRR